jgi:hypothetical protein
MLTAGKTYEWKRGERFTVTTIEGDIVTVKREGSLRAAFVSQEKMSTSLDVGLLREVKEK